MRILSDGNTIRGVLFGGSENTGIHIDGGNGNTIGGAELHQRNVFVAGTGVLVEHSAAGNTVVGNYFGTIDGEYAVTSGTGVRFQWGATGNSVADNLIVGHTDYGILLADSDGNQVSGNTIGARRGRDAPLPNTVGIRVNWADANVIGPFNFVAGNTGRGLEVAHSADTQVYGNTVGACAHSLGNGGAGVHILSGSGSRLTDNIIKCNLDDGIRIVSGEDHVVQQNFISRNAGDGVRAESTVSLVIGGNLEEEGNVIGGNGLNGVHLTGSETSGAIIAGNEIGIDLVLDHHNGGHGVLVEDGAHHNTIGGVDLRQGNWIAYNHQSGIWLSGASTSHNVLVGNVVGAPPDWDGTRDAGNGHHGIAIYDGAHHNGIGTIGVGNMVLDSGWSGIVIQNGDDNTVWFNRVGTDGAGYNWGNNYWGIVVDSGADNLITDNEVAYNGANPGDQAGVRVEDPSALHNEIAGNSIHSNDGSGIELIDGGNADLAAPGVYGGNCLLPLVGEAGYPCDGCWVDIYSDAGDEGRIWEGRISIAGLMGGFSWAGGVTGPNVTATVTDAAGNTSPFSTPYALGAICNQAPTAAFTFNPPNPMDGDPCTRFTFNASTSSDPEDDDASLQVCWDWDNNGACNTGWTTTKTAQYRLGLPALQSVRLLVMDSWGAIDATTSVIRLKSGCLQHFLPLVRR
jgi:parallel beta-helix repeat protein